MELRNSRGCFTFCERDLELRNFIGLSEMGSLLFSLSERLVAIFLPLHKSGGHEGAGVEGPVGGPVWGGGGGVGVV